MPDTASQVRQIIAEHFGRPVEDITDSTRLIEDLIADSLDALEFAMTIEDALNVNIDLNAEHRWDTVGDVVRYVEGLKGDGDAVEARTAAVLG